MIYVEANAVYANRNEAWIGYADRAHLGSVVATSETDIGPAENVTDGYTFDYWQPSVSGTQSLTFTVSGAVDYVAIAAHNAASEASAIVIESGGVERYRISSITDAAPILVHLVERSDTAWRITFEGATTALRVGVIHVGKLLQMQRTEWQGFTPPSLNRKDTRVPSLSESGHYLGQMLTRTMYRASPSWEQLTDDWYREQFDPFVLASQTRAFFLAWRPADHPNELVYGWRTGDVKPNNTGPANLMSVSFDLEAVTHDR